MALPEFTSIKSLINSSSEQITPPTVSDVPLINFVSEWITTSAPIFAGEKIIGVNVLSTTNLILYFFASLEIALISETSSKGLLIVSQKIIFVFSVIADSIWSIFVVSTNVVLILNFGK